MTGDGVTFDCRTCAGVYSFAHEETSSLCSRSYDGSDRNQKTPGLPKVTSEQIYAVEKGGPLVAVANQPPISAREFAAFSRALEEGRRQNRFGGLSRAHARPLLRILMEHISEESFNAGWFSDLEFRLWETIQKTTDRCLRPYERQGLKFLAGAACGWWTFGRFVSTKRWRGLYEAHRLAESANPIAPVSSQDDIPPRVDQAWKKETRRRIAEIERGETRSVPFSTVLAAARKRVGLKGTRPGREVQRVNANKQ